MRNAVLASVAALAASLALTGCPLAPTCGGWDGAANVAYQRGNDLAMACSNGGFTTVIDGRDFEGKIDNGRVTDGATGGFAYDFTGEGWDVVGLDQVGLDHADILCEDLASRPWWSAYAAFPQASAFVSATDAGCTDDSCLDIALFCPDNTVTLMPANRPSTTSSYTLFAGDVAAEVRLSGRFAMTGTLTTATEVWTSRTAASLGLSCQ